MTDTNPTRSRFAQNKRAFEDVLGDPSATPEPVDGHYNMLRARSLIKAQKINFDEGRATANPARPNVIDFICDVENAVKKVLKSDKSLLQRFNNTYIHDVSTGTELNQVERTALEQRIGRLFIIRKISPVARYFTAIRQ